MVMCENSLNVQNGLEKPAQQQIWIWESANAPILINEVRKEMEMYVLQVHSLQEIYLEKLLCRLNGDLHLRSLYMCFWAI